jgi:hypothetical protein
MIEPLRRPHGRLVTSALVVGVAGGAALAVGFVVDPRQAWFSYLTAFLYWLSLALGALIVVMIHHVANSTWFVAVRRIGEVAASPLVLLALLFVPILFGLHQLYPWVDPATIADAHARALVHRRAGYLNVPFFIARAAVYFLIWVVVSQLLFRWSVRQDDSADGMPLARRQVRLSVATLAPVGFALSWAAFDWLMTLSASWYSTIFGAYYFAGCAVAALALLTVASWLLQRDGALAGVVTVSHTHAMGKLLLTFLILWGYLGFCQLLLVWIADVPVEAAWYVVRVTHGWGVLGLILIVGHFALPFCALLSRALKRTPGPLAVVGVWLLAMHYVDLYWLVLPALHGDGLHPHWLDAAAFLAIGGLTVAFALWQLGGHLDAPRGDPRFARSLAWETR